MKARILSIIIILILLSSNSDAFDGNRKGFVLSGGVGWTHFQKSGNLTNRKNKVTYGFIIGYGFNNKNLLVVERSIFFDKYGSDSYIMDQINGFGWYHYYKANKKSKFVKIGYENLVKAIFIGGGYMFKNNIQIGLTYSHLLKVSDRNRIKLLLSYVAF